MWLRALIIGAVGTAVIFAILAIIAVLPVIIIFSIITGIAYVVIIDTTRDDQHDHKLPRGPP